MDPPVFYTRILGAKLIKKLAAFIENLKFNKVYSCLVHYTLPKDVQGNVK